MAIIQLKKAGSVPLPARLTLIDARIMLTRMKTPAKSATVPQGVARTTAPAGWRRVQRDALAWLVLPHFTPVVVVLAATYAFSVLARETFAFDLVTARLLLAMLGGQLAIGAVNELVDAELDAASKPHKPIPAGIISHTAARTLVVLSLFAMVGFSASFGAGSLILCSLGTGAGLVYDLWLKRTLLSWLPYLVALPLIPIWVWAAVDTFVPGLLILYPLGAIAVVGVHLSQALPDSEADRNAGIRSVSSVLGQSRSLALCWLSTLTAPAFASALASRLTDRPETVWTGSAAVVALVLTNVTIYVANPRAGIAACFPITASSTALMGLAWVLASR
jgi:4-hydroxybenzoate polyprenyltransferase